MIDYSVDTTRMTECGNDIIRLVAEYKDALSALNKRINDMPTITQEWVGEGATKFVRIFKVEKADYDNLGKILNAYGKILVKAADSIERAINSTKI